MMEDQALVPTEETKEITAYDQKLVTSTVDQIKTFMESKEKKILFNGKRYAEFEDWQYAASFFGLTARSYDTKSVEIDGRKGFHAKAAVVNKNGIEVGSAEGYCMNDEPNWKSKPLFQLASMAQTRAAAKALSNIFRPLFRLAGYEGTPGEEVQDMAKPPIKTPQPKPAPTAQEIVDPKPVSGDSEPVQEAIDFQSGPDDHRGKSRTINEAQRKLLFAKYKSAGIADEKIKQTMMLFWNIEHSKDLKMWQLDKLIEMINQGAIK